MKLFDSVLGQDDAASNKRMEEELKQIKEGEINKVYPILKPGDWIGVKAGAVKQTLIGSPDAPVLVVGFGYDAPTNFVFLLPSDLESMDPDKVFREAYTNLENVKSEFQVSTAMNGKVLTASGHDFSSEKILCRSHMMKAHELLQTKELLVSIPRRRCMMVTARGADKDLLHIFMALHNDAWEDDSYGNAPIINALFVVVDGQIEGMIPFYK